MTAARFPNAPSYKTILTGTLLVAFGLRILPITWGIPVFPFSGFYHPDEAKVFRSVFGFPENYSSNSTYVYGTAWQYLIGATLLPLKALMVWMKAIPGGGDGYVLLSIIYSRLFSTAAGTLAVYLGYLVAERLFDKETALATAVFICFSFYHCLHSALATLDVPMSCLLLLNLLLCFRAFEKGRASDYVLFGIASGFLLGMKIVGVIFLSVPIALGATAFVESRRDGFGRHCKGLLLYLSVACLVFMLTNPHVFLQPERFLRFMLGQKSDYLDPSQGPVLGMLQIWRRNIGDAVGWPVLILSFVGIVCLDRKARSYKAALLLFLALYCLFWRSFLLSRYVIFVAPLFCMLAAWGCISLWRSSSRPLQYAGMAAACVIICHSAFLSAAGVSLRFNDPRTQAARYIENVLRRGEAIGIGFVSKLGWGEHSWRYPRIDFRRFRDVSFLYRPNVVVLSSYDFKAIAAAPRFAELLRGSSAPSPRVLRMYDELLSGKGEYVLERAFKKRILVPIEFPPPEIRIYRKIRNR